MLPRRRAARLALLVLVAVTVVHLAAQVVGANGLADGTQVLLMPLLAGVVWLETAAPRSRLVRLTLVALGMSWFGDTAPKLTSGDGAFIVMVSFFLLAQVAYITAFLPYRAGSVLHARRWLLLGYGAAVAGLVAACAGGAGAMLVPVLVYGACLGAMAVLSTGVNRPTGVGGAAFLVSDGLIALEGFAQGFHLPGQDFWVMSTYVAAQVLIAGGVLLEDRRSRAHTQPDAVRSP